VDIKGLETEKVIVLIL